MDLPPFIQNLDELDLPFPSDLVKTHAIRSDRGLMVIFEALQDLSLPEHSHEAQWGTVLAGSLTLTMNGESREYGPGETYDIPSGTPHAAAVTAGSKVIDLFEEPDRYPLK